MTVKARVSKLMKATLGPDAAPTTRTRSFPWKELTKAEIQWVGKTVGKLLDDDVGDALELRSLSDEELEAQIAATTQRLAEIQAVKAKGTPSTSLQPGDLQAARALLAAAGMEPNPEAFRAFMNDLNEAPDP